MKHSTRKDIEDVCRENASLREQNAELIAALEKAVWALNVAWNSPVDGDVFGVHHNAATDATEDAESLIARLKKP